MLKHTISDSIYTVAIAAAFGRLCVETRILRRDIILQMAAAFGRLCVETLPPNRRVFAYVQPPSGGCVLKHCFLQGASHRFLGSRLRAAVC